MSLSDANSRLYESWADRQWRYYGIRVEEDSDPSAPMPYAVWTVVEGEREEIIGSGFTPDAARLDAEISLEKWRQDAADARRAAEQAAAVRA